MDYNAWFSSSEKDLDFCSERCYSQWTSNHDIQNHKKYIGISAVEEAIKKFENQGIPLADLQRIFYHENLFKEGVKKCRVSSCHYIVKFSEKDYCPYHDNREQEQNQLKPLVKQRSYIAGNIQELERFKTWWSNENIATIITHHNNSYWMFLGVIDRKPNNIGRVENNEIFIFSTNHTCSYWGEHSRKQQNYLSDTQSEANWLRKN